MITPQGTVEEASVQANGPIPVIIQMRDEPILARRNAVAALGVQERAQQLRQHQDRLVNAQSQLKTWIRTLEPGQRDEAFRHYRFAFNGMAAKVSPETLKKLKQRPDVARVFRDGTAKATVTTSVPLIGAPQMWSDYGANGQGIRVAVIDTGIDYTHPDLGGGFGPGFKVMGGYDFINGDADPMDDYGHGTHVAGIIAANGTLKGVAPGARLLAYKVLGADGSGPYSAIIAGIDRAVDPDQDPTTNDGAQVINLSLGGPGDPDDAISQAVDAAVSAGVVCVVAAGNSGSSYATLGSPGCARKALTVGASDDLDVMASFSSRGPSRPDFSIKPDLTAPGVSITSTVPGGGYQSMSGTSMATPHVAGAAALLLQLHPGWTPELVKAVLAERAKNLGQDAFTQGGGRVQVVASHLAKGVALPNNLNFGMVDLGQGIWTRSLPVRLRNLDAASRTYALAMQGSAVAGATWSVSPTSVTLAAGQSQDVTLTLTVDNSALPFGPPPTMAYEAKLVASASDDTFSIPAVYYKAAQLDLQFAQVPWYVFIFDQNADPNDGFSYEMRSGAPSLSFMLPPRKYDVICHFMMGPQGTYAESYVVREGIDLTSKQTLNINLDQEVLQHFVFKSFDGGGHEILFDSLRTKAVEREFRHSSGMGTTTFGGYSDWYFSNASSSYVFDQVRSGWAMDGDVNKYYEFRYALKDGINQSQTINNAPAQRVDLKYNIDPAVNYIWIDFYRYKNAPQMAVGMSSGEWARSGEIPPWVLSKPFRMEAHLSSLPYPGFTFNQSAPFVSRYDGGLGAGPRLMIGGLLGVRDGGVIGAHLMFSPDSPFYATSSGRMVIGESPHLWTGRLFFYSQGSALIQSAYGGATPLYLGQSGDGTVGDLPYELLQNGSPVRSGVIPGSGSPATSTNLDFAPGAYVLKVPYASYVVAGQRGHALATITFDSTKVDPAPPFLKRAAVLRDGVATSITTPGSLNQLSLQVGDTFGLTQVQASYQTTGGWVPLPLPLLSGPLAQCVVDLPAGLPEGPVNLKVTAADGQGNALTQEWAPAFYHSALTAPGITAQPQDVTVASGQPATFSVAAIGVGPLSYQWRKNGAAIGGATSSSYTTIPVATDDAARFSVVVTDAQGSVPSNEAILTVLTPPNLSTQPRSLGVMVGQTATFTVTATGTGPLSYQWRKNAVSISGATSSSYTTPPVTMADDGAAFSVVVTNAQGGVTSNDATLTVLTAPNLSAQPQSLSVAPGQTATFSVTATGTAPLSYQWRKGGVPIGGATSSRYTTPPATMADDGALFSVVVTNGQGSVTSDDAKLTVQASGPTVEVQPGTLGCFPGDTIVFSAKVTNAADNRVTWKASAGTIDDTGRFAAPGAPGTVTITATSVQDPSRTGTATVTVRGTDFDGNTALNPRLLGLAHAMGSTAPADLAKYDFNGDGRIDDADLAKLYQKMGW